MRTQLISNGTPDGSAHQALKHKAVLLQEVLALLDIKESDKVFDGTLGSFGHGQAILQKLGEKGVYIGNDLDEDAIERAKSILQKKSFPAEIHFCQGNFKDAEKCLEALGLKKVDKILMDLGWSQDQFEDSGRGFSFLKDEPLVMSYSKDSDLSASEIVNEWSEETLADIIYGFGEERFARRIAKAIVKARESAPIKSSLELAQIVESAYPSFTKGKKIHPATKTFQALRITVNRELEVLEKALDALHSVLSCGGRMAVISFHSLEDRIVKRKFLAWEREGLGKRITKKPIIASKEELKENKRARSAKLRVYEKEND